LGFGCKVLAHDIIPNEEIAKQKGFTYVTKDELLRQSDIGMIND
jgi:phosphoglycerate dehydrogenase-like enzyme